MSGSSGFSWIVDGEIVDIIFSLCRNGSWTDWDYAEDNPPYEFCKRKREYDYTELWDADCSFRSGIEFTYCNQRIVMSPEELQFNALFGASLIQGLKLPYKFPDKLGQFSIQDWDLDYFEGVLVNKEEVDIPFSECRNVQWTDLSVEPKCEFVGNFFEADEADEDDDDDSYYYLFNSGLEFTYLDHNIVMSSDDLEDLNVDTASMLLQVLNLDLS